MYLLLWVSLGLDDAEAAPLNVAHSAGVASVVGALVGAFRPRAVPRLRETDGHLLQPRRWGGNMVDVREHVTKFWTMSSSLVTFAHAWDISLPQTASLARSKKPAYAATTATASAGTSSRDDGAAGAGVWFSIFIACIF